MRLAPPPPPASLDSSFSMFLPPPSALLFFLIRSISPSRGGSRRGRPHIPGTPWPPLRALLGPLSPAWQSTVVKAICG
eukprot:9478252-Pyramimonas_sp.AAC.1